MTRAQREPDGTEFFAPGPGSRHAAYLEVARVQDEPLRTRLQPLEFERDLAVEPLAFEIDGEIQVEMARDETLGVGVTMMVGPVARIGVVRF